MLLVGREDLAVIREFESSGENIALRGMLACNGGFKLFVANKKPLISFTQLGCCNASDRKYKRYKVTFIYRISVYLSQ